MPVLHKYRHKQGHYILTAIGGNIIAFQLSREGQKKLRAAGVKSGNKFGRGLLLDLYRSGDAFTSSSGPGKIDSNNYQQLRFEFLDLPNDPEPESLFPRCSVCSSFEDLNFVEIRKPEQSAIILCPACRFKKLIDTSIPLPLVSRNLLAGILKFKNIQNIDKSVRDYKKLLDIKFENRWEVLVRTKPEQKKLLDVTNKCQKKLF